VSGKIRKLTAVMLPRGSDLAIAFLMWSCISIDAARAISINDNRAPKPADAANYWDQDNVYSYVAAVLFNGTCSGALINNRTIITAAHCFPDLNSENLEQTIKSTKISLNPDSSKPVPVTSIVNNSGYVKKGLYNDISIISLATPITNAAPFFLNADDTLAKKLLGDKALVSMAGYGDTGNGSSQKPQDADGRRRYATSTITSITEAQGTGTNQFYVTTFENPGVPSTSLSGAPESGDSGGPLWIVNQAGKKLLIAIVKGGGVDGKNTGYGGTNDWTPISNFYSWIMENNPLRTYSSKGGKGLLWSSASSWYDMTLATALNPNPAAVVSPNNQVTKTSARYYDVSISSANTDVTLDQDAEIDTLTIGHSSASLLVSSGKKLKLDVSGEIRAGSINVQGYIDAPVVTLSGGTLFAGQNNAFNSTMILNVNKGNFDLKGFSQGINTINLGGGTIENGSLAGSVFSTGGFLNKMGGSMSLTAASGVTSISGISNYSGRTTVDGGTLTVLGTLGQLTSVASTSVVKVNSGASLNGTGTILSDTYILPGGIFSAGLPGQIGSLTVNRLFQNKDPSIFEIEISSNDNDFVEVNGAASVGGDVVAVVEKGAASHLLGRNMTILTALGGVSGSYGSVSLETPLSFLNPQLMYDANDVYLSFSLTPFSFAARTINQRNVGNALTVGAYGAFSDPGANILNTLFYGSYQNAQPVMDAISGAGLAGVQTTAMEVGQMASSAVSDQIAFWRSGETADVTGVTLYDGMGLDRSRGFMAYAPLQTAETGKNPITLKGSIAGASPASPPARTFRAWSSMFGGGANFMADIGRGAPSATVGFYGGLIGVDYQLLPNILVGAAVGGSNANFSSGSLATSGSLIGFHASLYGAYTMGANYLALNETFSSYSNQTNRSAGGYSFLSYEQLNAHFGSREFRTRLEGGRTLSLGGLKATPFIAAELAAYASNAFTENSSLWSQSAFALRNNGQSTISLPTFIGLRLTNSIDLANGWRLTPVGSLAYVHEFFPQRQLTNILMSLPDQGFNVAGPRSTYNLVQTKIGAQLNLTKQLSLFADFQGEFSSASQTYGGKSGIRYVW
jgi:uncharacterized protein with beta-barrel porin domain